MSNILIIEDNDEINHLFSEVLESAGHQTQAAYSGPEGLRFFYEKEFDLVLLDLMLPGMSGEKILEEIRKTADIAVIVISAKSDIDEKVALLKNGANDYITKPFDMREVLARVELQLKAPRTGNRNIKSYGEISLNTESRTVEVNSSEVVLTRHEYNILELLLSNPQKVFSKQELYERAWDEYYVGEDKTINVHISNIRKKLSNYTDTEYIDTIWGIGFKIKKI